MVEADEVERANIKLEIEVAWALYNGDLCPTCGGRGWTWVGGDDWHSEPGEWQPCQSCNGWGAVQPDGTPFPERQTSDKEERWTSPF